MDKQTADYHVLVVGERRVGKTQLINRLFDINFRNDYISTDGVKQSEKVCSVNGKEYLLNFIQMAQIQSNDHDKDIFSKINYVLFVFDLTNYATYEAILQNISKIEHKLDGREGVRGYVIGNKLDLNKDRAVSEDILEQMRSYVNLSARDGYDPQSIMKIVYEQGQLIIPHKDFEHKQKAQYKGIKLQQTSLYTYTIQEDTNIIFTEAPFTTSIPVSITKITNQVNKHGVIINLLLLGQSGVGKSCILSALNEQNFAQQYNPTIGVDFRQLQIKHQGIHYTLRLWDIGGYSKYQTIFKCYEKVMNIGFLVFDITKRDTFDEIYEIFQKKLEHSEKYRIFVLIGNKIDLQQARTVTYQQCEQLALKIGCKYYEISAKTKHCLFESVLLTVETFILSNDKPIIS